MDENPGDEADIEAIVNRLLHRQFTPYEYQLIEKAIQQDCSDKSGE